MSRSASSVTSRIAADKARLDAARLTTTDANRGLRCRQHHRSTGIYQFPCAAELSRQLPITAVLLLIFAGPATAATGSLTYLKDGNGFLSPADGGADFQVRAASEEA